MFFVKKGLKAAFVMYAILLALNFVVSISAVFMIITCLISGLFWALYAKIRESDLLKLAKDVDPKLIRKEHDFFCNLMDIYEVKTGKLEGEEAKGCLKQINEYAENVSRIQDEKKDVASLAEFIGLTKKLFSGNEKSKEYYGCESINKLFIEGLESDKAKGYAEILSKCKVSNKSKLILLMYKQSEDFLLPNLALSDYIEKINKYHKYFDVLLESMFDSEAGDDASNNSIALFRTTFKDILLCDDDRLIRIAFILQFFSDNLGEFLKNIEEKSISANLRCICFWTLGSDSIRNEKLYNFLVSLYDGLYERRKDLNKQHNSFTVLAVHYMFAAVVDENRRDASAVFDEVDGHTSVIRAKGEAAAAVAATNVVAGSTSWSPSDLQFLALAICDGEKEQYKNKYAHRIQSEDLQFLALAICDGEKEQYKNKYAHRIQSEDLQFLALAICDGVKDKYKNKYVLRITSEDLQFLALAICDGVKDKYNNKYVLRIKSEDLQFLALAICDGGKSESTNSYIHRIGV